MEHHLNKSGYTFRQLKLDVHASFVLSSKIYTKDSLNSRVHFSWERMLLLTTLETRFLRADLIEVFKILRGFENLDPDMFFQVVGDGVRRGHIFKMFKKRYRLDVGKFKFASRVCDEWNRLGDGIVSAGTVNVFKMRLDHHLRNVRGYL